MIPIPLGPHYITFPTWKPRMTAWKIHITIWSRSLKSMSGSIAISKGGQTSPRVFYFHSHLPPNGSEELTTPMTLINNARDVT